MVNFIVAGAQKAGTTALRSYLRDHSDISMPKREVHFFDKEKYFKKSPIDYSIYHGAFNTSPSENQLIGETTPIYLYWRNALQRIWRYHHGMKIIVMLRNPIERAYSHWNMEVKRKKETLPFSEAIRMESQRCRKALPQQHRVYSYVDRGFYVEQLRRLWFYFPKEQTLILKNMNLRRRPGTVLKKVAEFLEISDFPKSDQRTVHSIPYTRAMQYNDWHYLKKIYEFEIRQIERMLGWNCSEWLHWSPQHDDRPS